MVMVMVPFLKKKKNENELIDIALKFLDEDVGEVELAMYHEIEKMPFEVPIVKFIEWAKSKGYNIDEDFDKVREVLVKAFRRKLAEKGIV